MGSIPSRATKIMWNDEESVEDRWARVSNEWLTRHVGNEAIYRHCGKEWRTTLLCPVMMSCPECLGPMFWDIDDTCDRVTGQLRDDKDLMDSVEKYQREMFPEFFERMEDTDPADWWKK